MWPRDVLLFVVVVVFSVAWLVRGPHEPRQTAGAPDASCPDPLSPYSETVRRKPN